MSAPSPVRTAVAIESPDASGDVPRYVAWLTIGVVLTVILHAALWITGFESRRLTMAVDDGAARIVRKSVGETTDDVIRKAIALQKSTLPFWTTLIRLSDFLIDPLALVLRALTVATIFSALAALTGRPIRFTQAMNDSAATQLYWVAGLAVRVGLMIAMREPGAETSAVLLLEPGRYHASMIVLLRQVDPFILYGWLHLAWSAWRRGQANLFVCLSVCLTLALSETLLRCLGALFVGGGMRLSILPETMGR